MRKRNVSVIQNDTNVFQTFLKMLLLPYKYWMLHQASQILKQSEKSLFGCMGDIDTNPNLYFILLFSLGNQICK